MNCEFCNKNCQQDGNWWTCYHCEASFEESKTLGHHIQFQRSTEDWDYALNLYPESNLTVLTGFQSDFFVKPKDRGRLEIRIPHLMQNVNQHNAMDKIRFILLFQ